MPFVRWSLILVLLWDTGLALAQEIDPHRRFEFVKENGKPMFLRHGRDIELHLIDSLPPIKGVRRTHRVEGSLLYTTKDSIAIAFREENWSERTYDPFESFPSHGRSQRIFAYDTLDLPRAYALQRIDHVTYSSKVQGMGTAITVFSAIGLLVYAPLKAMRFKDGTFDGDRYLRVATACLIGVGVGLVVMPFTDGERRVKVKLGM